MKIDFNEFKNLCCDAERVVVYEDDDEGNESEYAVSVAFDYGQGMLIDNQGIAYDITVKVKEDGSVVVLDLVSNILEDIPDWVNEWELEAEVKTGFECLLEYGNWHEE